LTIDEDDRAVGIGGVKRREVSRNLVRLTIGKQQLAKSEPRNSELALSISFRIPHSVNPELGTRDPGVCSMSSSSKTSDPLTDEILTEAAESFFGACRELEKNLEQFYRYVQILQTNENAVTAKAQYLNYLLIDPDVAARFYGLLNIDWRAAWPEVRLPQHWLPPAIPLALSVRRRFAKLVLLGYDELRRACRAHVTGPGRKYSARKDAQEIPVYYNLVKEMNVLVNEEIRKLNESFSPSGVLEFARKLNPDVEMTARLGGMAYTGALRRIDRKLRYPPIEFEDLHLKKFPELPPKEMVYPKIVAFCGQVYHGRKKEIRRLIADLKIQIRKCDRHC
jgi:hypothetical protein